TVTADIGDHAAVVSAGTIQIQATESEDIIGIAAGIPVAGDAGAAGPAPAEGRNEAPKANIGQTAKITTTGGGNLTLAASDTTFLVSVAGSLGISGGAAVGVGADVGLVTKDTYAYIDSGVTATIAGDVMVDAESSELLDSVAAGIGVGDV